jgi:ABC-type sugar transport system substrate-binding protein
MKKILVIILSLILVSTLLAGCGASDGGKVASDEGKVASDEGEVASDEGEAKSITVGYFKAAADDYYKAGWDVFNALAVKEGWEVYEIMGDGTDAKMLAAIEDFITQKVDAIVCVQTTSASGAEVAKKAKEADIPFFSLTHQPDAIAGFEPTGASCYDWIQTGIYAGDSALEYGAEKIIMIEGVQGQGTAAGQTIGFLQSYEDAGQAVEVVFTGYGNWFAQGALKAMDEALAAVGPDGFDGVYVHNDEMLDGVLQAIENAGLDSSNYWMGSSNGKEKSWVWVADGKVTMDVNQTASLEADLVFQMIQAEFAGTEYKHYVYSMLKPFTKDNMDNLVPYGLDAYMKGREEGAFTYELKDPVFEEWSF